MKSEEASIGIIIVNFNGSKDTIACLESLLINNINTLLIRIIVVDNGSDKGQLNLLNNFIKMNVTNNKPSNFMFQIIVNVKNLGFAQGNNIGIQDALANGCTHILLINNDTFVNQDFLVSLWNFVKSKRDGVFGPKIYFAPGCEYHYSRYTKQQRGKVIWFAGGQIDWQNVLFSHRGVDEVDKRQYDVPIMTDFISGCAMLISKNVFDKIGLFDERYFTYLEDADFSWRAKLAGFELWYVPEATLWHKNASSSGKPGSPLHIYYQTRNRLIFGFKYASLRAKAALLRESLKYILTDSQRRKAVIDYYLGKTGSI